MHESLPFVPYPFIKLPDESLNDDPYLYVAPDRIICNGNITFKTKQYPLAKVLSERFQEEWSSDMAEDMARRVIRQAKGNILGRDLFVSAFLLPYFTLSHLQLAYCGKHQITGREVTYEWPSGKITRINKIIYGYTLNMDSCVLYVRHEDASLPGKIHQKLKFPVK